MKFESIEKFIEAINSGYGGDYDVVDIDLEQAHFPYKNLEDVNEDGFLEYYTEEIMIIPPHNMGFYPVRDMEFFGMKSTYGGKRNRVKNHKNKSKNKNFKHRY